MYKYGLHMRVKDENASQGYRFTGCRNFVNLADAKESARNGAWECDLLDLVEYGKGLIERYWISEIVN